MNLWDERNDISAISFFPKKGKREMEELPHGSVPTKHEGETRAGQNTNQIAFDRYSLGGKGGEKRVVLSRLNPDVAEYQREPKKVTQLCGKIVLPCTGKRGLWGIRSLHRTVEIDPT